MGLASVHIYVRSCRPQDFVGDTLEGEWQHCPVVSGVLKRIQAKGIHALIPLSLSASHGGCEQLFQVPILTSPDDGL